jgi:3-dehydroquinate dehydratase II
MTNSTPRAWVINGPNLNLLGQREPHIYGYESLQSIEQSLVAHGQNLGVMVQCFQSNHEGALIDLIHQAATEGVQYLVMNAGAYTHSSIALRDALVGVKLPYVEVHLSNIYARETFRHHSYLSANAQAVVCGMGSAGYYYALDFIKKNLT